MINSKAACEKPLAGHTGTGRIEGYDLARAFAILAMIAVNYDVIFPGAGLYQGMFDALFELFYGRVAALLVMLAGTGLTLMTRKARTGPDRVEFRRVRTALFKRSVILFIMGIIFMRWWNADILHFYGLYLIIGAFVTGFSDRRIWAVTALVFIVSSVLYCITDGRPGLEEITTSQGVLTCIIDDLFVNGYYSAFPWLSFLFIGIWLGRLELISDKELRRRMFIWASSVFLIEDLATRYLPLLKIGGYEIEEGGIIDMLLISNVFPVSPIFTVSAAAGSALVILAALHISGNRRFSRLAGSLASTGRMSLTIYIAHIFAAYGLLEIMGMLNSEELNRTINLSFKSGAWIMVVIFSNIWLRNFRQGPFEGLLRRYSGS